MILFVLLNLFLLVPTSVVRPPWALFTTAAVNHMLYVACVFSFLWWIGPEGANPSPSPLHVNYFVAGALGVALFPACSWGLRFATDDAALRIGPAWMKMVMAGTTEDADAIRFLDGFCAKWKAEKANSYTRTDLNWYLCEKNFTPTSPRFGIEDYRLLKVKRVPLSVEETGIAGFYTFVVEVRMMGTSLKQEISHEVNGFIEYTWSGRGNRITILD